MITYENEGLSFLVNIFRLHGSVFPKAMRFSVPNALFAGVFVALIWDFEDDDGQPIIDLQDPESVMNNNAIWGGFNFLVGFLVVFRTSQAYNRFWEGATQTHKMGAEWFDACSSLMAFTKHSDAEKEDILRFQNTLIRLFSMLHAAALGEIEDCGDGADRENSIAYNLDLIDPEALSGSTLQIIRDCDAKVDLIFQWIQQLVVVNIKSSVLSIPPPILSRSFQEIATGMVHFHEAMKISAIPFPFPYAQTCDALLVLHWLVVPFIVSQWVTRPWWAFLFSFIQVFTLWTLNLIAVELENPFGTDPNDIDGTRMQLGYNNSLRLLMKVESLQIPTSYRDGCNQAEMMCHAIEESFCDQGCHSFSSVWRNMDASAGSQKLDKLDRPPSIKNFRAQLNKNHVRTHKSIGTTLSSSRSKAFSTLTSAPSRTFAENGSIEPSDQYVQSFVHAGTDGHLFPSTSDTPSSSRARHNSLLSQASRERTSRSSDARVTSERDVSTKECDYTEQDLRHVQQLLQGEGRIYSREFDHRSSQEWFVLHQPLRVFIVTEGEEKRTGHDAEGIVRDIMEDTCYVNGDRESPRGLKWQCLDDPEVSMKSTEPRIHEMPIQAKVKLHTQQAKSSPFTEAEHHSAPDVDLHDPVRSLGSQTVPGLEQTPRHRPQGIVELGTMRKLEANARTSPRPDFASLPTPVLRKFPLGEAIGRPQMATGPISPGRELS